MLFCDDEVVINHIDDTLKVLGNCEMTTMPVKDFSDANTWINEALFILVDERESVPELLKINRSIKETRERRKLMVLTDYSESEYYSIFQNSGADHVISILSLRERLIELLAEECTGLVRQKNEICSSG